MGIAQQPVEPLGPRLLGFVERQGSGERAQGQPPVAAPRPAPELERGDRQEREAQGQPATQIGGDGRQQREDALDQRGVLPLEPPARSASGFPG